MPTPTSLDLNGLNLSKETVGKLLTVDVGAWLNEVEELKNYYKIFGEKFPSEIVEELHLLEAALVDKNPKLTESF
jgi:phosphoenolpyruvate carboxykinase (GTP)